MKQRRRRRGKPASEWGAYEQQLCNESWKDCHADELFQITEQNREKAKIIVEELIINKTSRAIKVNLNLKQVTEVGCTQERASISEAVTDDLADSILSMIEVEQDGITFGRRRQFLFNFNGQVCAAIPDFVPLVVTRQKTVAIGVGEDKQIGRSFRCGQLDGEVVGVATDLCDLLQTEVTLIVLQFRGLNLKVGLAKVTPHYLKQLRGGKPKSELEIKQCIESFRIPRQLSSISYEEKAGLQDYFALLHYVKCRLAALASEVKKALKRFKLPKRKRLAGREKILEADMSALEARFCKVYPDVLELASDRGWCYQLPYMDFDIIRGNLHNNVYQEDPRQVFEHLRYLVRNALERANDKATIERCITCRSWLERQIDPTENALAMYLTDTDQSETSHSGDEAQDEKG